MAGKASERKMRIGLPPLDATACFAAILLQACRLQVSRSYVKRECDCADAIRRERLDFDLTSPIEFKPALADGLRAQGRRRPSAAGSSTTDSRPTWRCRPSRSSRSRSGSAARRCATPSRFFRQGTGPHGAPLRHPRAPVEDWNLLDGDVVGWHEPGPSAHAPHLRRDDRAARHHGARGGRARGRSGRPRRRSRRSSPPPTRCSPSRTTCRRSSTPTAAST